MQRRRSQAGVKRLVECRAVFLNGSPGIAAARDALRLRQIHAAPVGKTAGLRADHVRGVDARRIPGGVAAEAVLLAHGLAAVLVVTARRAVGGEAVALTGAAAAFAIGQRQITAEGVPQITAAARFELARGESDETLLGFGLRAVFRGGQGGGGTNEKNGDQALHNRFSLAVGPFIRRIRRAAADGAFPK